MTIAEILRDAYDMMLTSRDFAMVSQFRELQIHVIRTLEEMARTLGDTAAADLHQSRLRELQPA
jgi:ferritin-like metal-binding protein YciE